MDSDRREPENSDYHELENLIFKRILSVAACMSAVLALGPVSQARGQRAILASRRARQNRRVQVA
jgi:hypothetical protein